MWAVKIAFVGTVAASHYEKPPCQADEMAGQLASGAEMCAPKCSASGACPTDAPAGTKATPQCALKTTSGDKYCGLVCKAASECPTGGQCTKPVPFMPTGICTYKTGVAAPPPAKSPESLFEEFAAQVGRLYTSTEERQHRFSVFVENLEHITRMQALDESATYSHLSPFADWSVAEFSALNTLKPELLDASKVVQDAVHNTSGLPDSFDWVSKGAVNPVKNQEQCGSCWAFSTVANIEGVNFVKTNKLVSLSEQQLVDCDKTSGGDQGCQGGLPSNAFKYMIANKMGLDTESKYPYTAKDGTCHVQKADEQVFISSWKQIASDEDQMAAALVQYGPLSIGINAGPMQWYHGGIANPWTILCNPKSIDHGVAIVGFGVEDSKKYWKIRNSWGASWGEKGYYRIIRGVNKCGLTTMPTTAIIGGSSSSVVV